MGLAEALGAHAARAATDLARGHALGRAHRAGGLHAERGHTHGHDRGRRGRRDGAGRLHVGRRQKHGQRTTTREAGRGRRVEQVAVARGRVVVEHLGLHVRQKLVQRVEGRLELLQLVAFLGAGVGT